MPSGVSAVCFDPNRTDEQFQELPVANAALSFSAMLAVDNPLAMASASLGLDLPALSTWTLCRKA
jgi:hypothetical protein